PTRQPAPPSPAAPPPSPSAPTRRRAAAPRAPAGRYSPTYFQPASTAFATAGVPLNIVWATVRVRSANGFIFMVGVGPEPVSDLSHSWPIFSQLLRPSVLHAV